MNGNASRGVVCAAFLICIAAVPSAAPEARRVVLLYDERTDLPGLAILDASLVQSLTSGSAESIEVYREAMDLSRFGSDTYLDVLSDYLRAKYAAKKIDAVVAVMGPALDFLLSRGDLVFPGTPIVFCGIDRREIEHRALSGRVTGVLVKREFSSTLQVALQLHPDTTRVVFVAGTSDFDVRLIEQARGEFHSYDDRLAFTYLTTLSLRELLAQLANLPRHTLVLYSTMFRDGAGEAFVPHEVAERITAAANVPVYGFVDQFLGRGIVGGHLYSLASHGQQAAGLVRQILAGKQSSELPLMEDGGGAYLFDWRQMKRWQIAESLLPAGSVVRFRETSTWERYKSTILTVMGILALQSVLIVALLFERRIRQHAQNTLRDKETALRRSNEQIRDLAGQLITSQEAEGARIARELHDDVSQQLAGFSIAISALKRRPEAQNNVGLHAELATLQHRSIDLCENIRHISHDLHPGMLRHAGLVAALKSHCGEFAKQHAIPVAVSADPDLGVIDDVMALCLYRITQEAFRNIAKHAGACHVDVILSRSEDEVVLSIADDGKGFDLEKVRQHGGGLGLRSIDERVRLASGQVSIETAPGRGTTLSVRLFVQYLPQGQASRGDHSDHKPNRLD